VEKKKIMKKIGREPRPAEVNISDQAFPELGSEPVKSEKKEDVKSESTQSSNSNLGPKRFVNAKKTGQGENFAPMETVQEKDPVIVTPVLQAPQEKSTEKVFSRATEAPVITETTPPQDDGKFKFGGIKKFTSTKGPTKVKEEEKSEQDILREQKEKDAEEKIMKEKEEFHKQKEAMDKKRDMNGGKKLDFRKNDTKPEDNGENEFHEIKPHKVHHHKEEHEHHGEEKKHSENRSKGSNQKNGQKPSKKQSEEIVKEIPVQVVEDPKEAKPLETKVVVTTAGTAGWDEGGMVRKPKKN